VSLLNGCDGAILIQSWDGTYASKGFEWDCVPDVLGTAQMTKGDGTVVVAGPSPQNTAGSWLNEHISQGSAYVDGNSGNPVTSSQIGRMGVWFGTGHV
jgi:hypothetical protein